MIKIRPSVEVHVLLVDPLLYLLLNKVLELVVQNLQLTLEAIVLAAQFDDNLLLLGQRLALGVWILNISKVSGHFISSLCRRVSLLLPVLATASAEFLLHAAPVHLYIVL